MSIFRETAAESSALEEYLQAKRREFVGASGDATGAGDAQQLRGDLEALDRRIERQLVAVGKSSVCYLVMGRVQSGKTGHQLGMLAWAADKCDVAVIFTGVTEALNGQTSYRIAKDLGTLPSNPVSTMPVPTRARAQRDPSFLENVLRRTKQRRDYRGGDGMWPERLPILVSMKTKPRVDALKWMFQEVANTLGEGVTALIIDDEADQASPNAAARRGEEAATYAELKALRDAATKHTWLSYTATPQAIFLTERDGALRPDFCAVSRPGTGYFGVGALVGQTHKSGRIPVQDWVNTVGQRDRAPSSLTRSLCELLAAAWLRSEMPEGFYRRADGPAPELMRSVQMLVHTSSKVQDHADDFDMIEGSLQSIRDSIEAAIRGGEPSKAPLELTQAWTGLADRVTVRTGGTVALPPLEVAQLYALGKLISRVEKRVVNSAPNRPTAQAGPLPTSTEGWEAHPIWIVIGGDILGRGLTIPQLVTTYFTRLAQSANEDTVSQQMRFCGYRSTYSHVLTIHALPDIFRSFEYLAQVERVLISTAQDWQDRDKNLLDDEPALWYVSRPTNRMIPTRLAVRDRDLVDVNRKGQVLSLKQFCQPAAFSRNSAKLIDWLEGYGVVDGFLDEWMLAESGSDELRDLLDGMRTQGQDNRDREVAVELMSKRLGELGLANLPCAIFARNLDVLRTAAAGKAPGLDRLPVRRLGGQSKLPPNARAIWQSAWPPRGGVRAEQWFDVARIDVPHVGDAQRRPAAELGYAAVTAVIEPVAVHAGDEKAPVGAGLAISIQTPEGVELRVIGVEAAAAAS